MRMHWYGIVDEMKYIRRFGVKPKLYTLYGFWAKSCNLALSTDSLA